jgi:hypothetical protein
MQWKQVKYSNKTKHDRFTQTKQWYSTIFIIQYFLILFRNMFMYRKFLAKISKCIIFTEALLSINEHFNSIIIRCCIIHLLNIKEGQSWSYGSWILIMYYVSTLTLWVRVPFKRGVLDTTLCDKVCQWHGTGQWFSPGAPFSSTNKTDSHDIIEILLKVALNTINQTKP